jgi:hypothetical protein
MTSQAYRVQLTAMPGYRKEMHGPFVKRRQARQWCRNHWWSISHTGMTIIHPDGTLESYGYKPIRRKT